MFKKLHTYIYNTMISGSLLAPLSALAVADATAFDDIIDAVIDTLNNYILPFLFVLATLLFVWGVIMYIAQSDDEAARKKARGLMLWGIIGLAVILAVWGITALIIDYFGVGGVGIPDTGDVPSLGAP